MEPDGSRSAERDRRRRLRLALAVAAGFLLPTSYNLVADPTGHALIAMSAAIVLAIAFVLFVYFTVSR